MRIQTHASYRGLFLALLFLAFNGGVASAQQEGENPKAQTPAVEDASASAQDPKESEIPDAPATPEGGIEPAEEPAQVNMQAQENMPVNLRLRQLEQRVQALKERAWRAKARVGMLKESVLGGGVGARASITHVNKMGSSFRLTKLVYALDGAQIFAKADTKGDMYKEKTFEILNGPVSPGSHTISVLAIYQGHGYGVFKYMSKFKYTVRSSHTFNATEGKGTALRAEAYEKGGMTTKVEDRPAIDFKVSYNNGAEE